MFIIALSDGCSRFKYKEDKLDLRYGARFLEIENYIYQTR